VFDIGFSELLVVFVVGLLVLGPERLPHAAKMAGLWVRKIKRSINSVQREINAQLDQEELQQKISETNQRLLKEERAIQNTILPMATQDPIAVHKNTQPDIELKTAPLADKQQADTQQVEPEKVKEIDQLAHETDKVPEAPSRP
jgi:sec-independent protein translocase protein TatB